MKRAFTLIEVNLAMLVMAGGILSLVGLYGLGFRESTQSIEDVDGAAFADQVLSQAAWGLSQTNLAWSAFDSISTTPGNGWRDYVERNGNNLVAKSGAESIAKQAFGAISVGGAGLSAPSAPSDMTWGMVVTREPDSAVVTLAVRVVNQSKSSGSAALLLSQPIYVTQVRFQGDPNK